MYQALYLQEQEENKQLKARIEELEDKIAAFERLFGLPQYKYIRS